MMTQDVGMMTSYLVGEAPHPSLQNHYVMGQGEAVEPCEHVVILLVYPL